MTPADIERVSALFEGGMTLREIGRVTGIPMPTAAYHMRRLHPDLPRSKGGAPTHRRKESA